MTASLTSSFQQTSITNMTGKKDQIFDSAELCCRYWKIVLIHCLELIAASLRPHLFRGMCKNIHICNKSLLDKTLKHKKPRICKLWHFWFSHTEVDDLPWLRGAVYCQWKFLLQPGSRWDRGRPFGKHCRTGSNPGWLPVWSPKSVAQLLPRSWCWGWSRSSTWKQFKLENLCWLTWRKLLENMWLSLSFWSVHQVKSIWLWWKFHSRPAISSCCTKSVCILKLIWHGTCHGFKWSQFWYLWKVRLPHVPTRGGVLTISTMMLSRVCCHDHLMSPDKLDSNCCTTGITSGRPFLNSTMSISLQLGHLGGWEPSSHIAGQAPMKFLSISFN